MWPQRWWSTWWQVLGRSWLPKSLRSSWARWSSTAMGPSAQTVRSAVFNLGLCLIWLLLPFSAGVVTILGAWGFWFCLFLFFIFLNNKRKENTVSKFSSEEEAARPVPPLCEACSHDPAHHQNKRWEEQWDFFLLLFFYLVASILTGSTVATSMLVELSFSSITSFSTFKDSTVASFRDMD